MQIIPGLQDLFLSVKSTKHQLEDVFSPFLRQRSRAIVNTMASNVEADNTSVTAQPRFSCEDYSQLFKKLSDNLIKRDIRKMVFLCHDMVKDKSFLAKKELRALELFKEMNRNGTLSPDDITVLSQVMYLIGKKKLQKDQLTSRGVPEWQPDMKSRLCNFRHLLYKLYQEIRGKDLDTMKDYCLLCGKLSNAETAEINDALDLFTALIDNQTITPKDIEFLCSLVDGVHNAKMNKMVKTYKEEFIQSKDPKFDEHKSSSPGNTLCTGNYRLPEHSKLSYPYSTLPTGVTPSTGSYMDEKVAGPSLKVPGEFEEEPKKKGFGYTGQTSEFSDLESLDKEKSRLPFASTLSSSMDPSSMEEERAKLAIATGLGNHAEDTNCTQDDEESGMSLASSALMDPSSITSSQEQAKLDKKTGEIEDELKAVGGAGDEELSGAAGGSESSSGASLEERLNRMGLDAPDKIGEQTKPVGATGGANLDKEDFNFTARTERVQALFDGLKQKDQAANAAHTQREHLEGGKLKDKERKHRPLESTDESELRVQEQGKMRRAKEKERKLESSDDEKESTDESELRVQEQEKMRRAKEKERKLESSDNEKAPQQETRGADGDSPSTMALIEQGIQRPEGLGRYPMKRVPRGKCLLLMYDKYDPGHNPRPGNEVDCEKLQELFKILNFEVIVELNKTRKETKDIIESMRIREDHGDCFICFVCSHGNGEAFVTKDGKTFEFRDLYDNFSADQCAALVEKPKLFFMNMCLRRSDVKFQRFIPCSTISSDGPESLGIGTKDEKLVPKYSDFFISYSTVAGYSSARHNVEGTFYVQNVYKIFKEYHQNLHLPELCTAVRNSVNSQFLGRSEGYCQVCPDYSTLNKLLYF